MAAQEKKTDVAAETNKTEKTEVKEDKKDEKRMVVIKERDPKEVLARFPGGKVTRGDILEHLVGNGVPIETPRPESVANELEAQIAAYVAFLKYVVPLAEKSGISKEKEYQIQQTKNQILLSGYLDKQADGKVTPKDIETTYNEYLEKMKNEKVFGMSAIITKNEEEARKILKEFSDPKNKGKDEHVLFVELLDRHAPTSPEGEKNKRQQGKLGDMTKNQIVMLFGEKNAQAILKLRGNSLFPTPVKVGNAWFVLRVDEVKDFDMKEHEYSKVKDQVDQFLRKPLVARKKTAVVEALIADKEFEIKVPGQDKFKKFSESAELTKMLAAM